LKEKLINNFYTFGALPAEIRMFNFTAELFSLRSFTVDIEFSFIILMRINLQ